MRKLQCIKVKENERLIPNSTTKIKTKHRQGHKILNGRKKFTIIKCVQCKHECENVLTLSVSIVWASTSIHVLDFIVISLWFYLIAYIERTFVFLPNAPHNIIHPVELFCTSSIRNIYFRWKFLGKLKLSVYSQIYLPTIYSSELLHWEWLMFGEGERGKNFLGFEILITCINS